MASSPPARRIDAPAPTRFENPNDPDVARSQIGLDASGRAIAIWGTNQSLWVGPLNCPTTVPR